MFGVGRLGRSRRHLSRGALALCLCMAPASAVKVQERSFGTDPALSEISLSHDGENRSYFVHDGSTGPDARLLIALHGGGPSVGDTYARRTGFAQLAATEGFVVVFPNGMFGQWNDGRGVAFGRANSTDRGVPDRDDVGFIALVMDDAIFRFGVDPDQIFVEGTSNGGMMTQRLACELSGRIAGAASVISSMSAPMRDTCAPTHPVPMMILNGTKDPIVPYYGGTVAPFGRSSGEVISTDATVQFWLDRNGCRRLGMALSLPNRVWRDRSQVEVLTSQGCADAPVVLVRVIGGGHGRPGAEGRQRERFTGPTNRDINASEVIWRFFSEL